MATPSASKIMIVRHAEKPAKDGQAGPSGVDEQGNPDPHSLIVRGWERAGALAVLFAPPDGRLAHPALATPQWLFAANFEPSRAAGSAGSHGGEGGQISKRPQQTLWPLAAKLGSRAATNYQYYVRQDEARVAPAMLACSGVILLAWEHKNIPLIAGGIPLTPNTPAPPVAWPDTFDVIWIFDREGDESGTYRWQQLNQQLLAGDTML